MRSTCLSLLLALVAPQLPAQEPTEAPPQEARVDGETVFFRAGYEGVIDEKAGRATLVGEVELKIGPRTVRCDNLVVWFDPDSPVTRPEESAVPEGFRSLTRRVREVYAEGHVLYEHDPETIQCERLYLDLVNERGLVLDGVLRADVRRSKLETLRLTLRAEEWRLLGSDRFEGIGVRVAASPFDEPGYNLRTQRLVLLREPAPEGEGSQYALRVEDNALEVDGLGAVWLPDFVADTAARSRFLYITKLRYGRSSEFGHEPGVSMAYRMGLDEESETWIEPGVEVDWFSRRGIGLGTKIEYGSKNYNGVLRTRYQADSGTDEAFGDPPTENRGRISFLHRHELPGEVLVDAELQVFSDRGYYPTFYEREFKGEKLPENLLYARRLWDDQMLSGLFKHRFNDWETTTEARPEVRYDLVNEHLGEIGGTDLYLETTARVGDYKRRFDDALGLRTRSSQRADLDQLLSAPFDLGPIVAKPFVGARATWYEEDRFGRADRTRFGGTFGLTLSSTLSRDYAAEGGFFDLDGLRHVVLPEITFEQVTGVALEPNDLVRFDEVEDYEDMQVVTFRLRNLFQTRRHDPALDRVETFLDVELSLDWFPRGDPRDDDHIGPLDLDTLVRLGRDLDLITDFELDRHRGMEVFNTAVGYIPSYDWQAWFGYRHFKDTYDAVFFETRYRINHEWRVLAESSYDFLEDRSLDHGLFLTRVGAEWVQEIGFEFDGGENDFRVLFSVLPRPFWGPEDRAPLLRNEPRFRNVGRGFLR